MAIAVVVLGSTSARAAPSSCGSEITGQNVVLCVLRASLAVRRGLETTEAAQGRRSAVAPLLPSNPVVTLSVARPAGAGTVGAGTVWYGSLGQELEIAGQRAARKRSADAEIVAAQSRVLQTQRDVAALALDRFYEALAADEEVRLALRLEHAALRVRTSARGMADKGLLAPVDADLADASSVRIVQTRLAAERRLQTARSTLASLLGLGPSEPLVLRGDLTVLPGTESLARAGDGDALNRPEVLAAIAEGKAFESRAEAYRRARIPNVTVSIFAENDIYNDKAVGVGVSLPIPLPQPVGRTYAGEIRETSAFARRAEIDADQVKRDLRLELANSRFAFESRRAALEAFTPEQLARAEQSLEAVALEIEAGRLAIRDAIVTQQTLIGLLLDHIEAKRALCVASVDLARASGVALERGQR